MLLPLLLLLLLCLLREGNLSDIVAEGQTTVVFAQDVSLSCTLLSSSGVKQVTWQRVRGQDVQTVATYSENFKDYVDEKFAGKITLNASLNSTSIKIKNTMFDDEACYICSFNLYPAGPKRETLCLTVKGISEVTATMIPDTSSDPGFVVVSCSATGKPSPTLQWRSGVQELEVFTTNYTTGLNRDGSSTVSRSLSLPRVQFQGKHLECVAQSDDQEKTDLIVVPEEKIIGK
ncbi:hypothetical protein DNTS_000082 [Danionella cerebrum]|uniref:Ig-like domain-containing protein n=1 Tax=Danionella cerebrum TaxID=2873325 RepID=A0A553RK05_9TELE|nr:hypothetical protein DNTS_000082 [Danionella translucida]